MEAVARMVALDHKDDPRRGYREAGEHTPNHLKIVFQHCFVVENDDEKIIAVTVMHPQNDLFEIEDLHVKEVQQNREAFALLKAKLWEYLGNVQTEVLCCPYALRRLMATY